jgi:hypothetical protein
VVVNEQYVSSRVVTWLAWLTARLGMSTGLTVRTVRMEMSKHRGLDANAGRFLDHDLGVLGYEGPHLVAAVIGLGQRIGIDLWPDGPSRACATASSEVSVCYRARGLVDVEIYSSMTGRLRLARAWPEGLGQGRGDIGFGSDDRFRVMSVSGTDWRGRAWEMAGLFEPIAGLPRNQAVITVWCDGQQVQRHPACPRLAQRLPRYRAAGPQHPPPPPAVPRCRADQP